MTRSAIILITKFLCYYIGFILSGCSKNVTPLRQVPVSTANNNIEQLHHVVNRFAPSVPYTQALEQLLEEPSDATKQSKWTNKYIRDYCNEMNGIVDTLEKKQHVHPNQLRVAFNTALEAINHLFLSAKRAFSAATHPVETSLSAKLTHSAIKMDGPLDSFAIFKQKCSALNQILQDLNGADEQNILNEKFRLHLDNCVQEALELKQVADQLAKHSTALFKKLAKAERRSHLPLKSLLNQLDLSRAPLKGAFYTKKRPF